tara:strand:+ start:100 stop:834 length:735 start_codon:yes stop_codon:yes gene_type:complete
MEDMANGNIQMVFADLPYGTTAAKWDTVIDLARMWKNLYRLCKPNATFVFTASQPFTSLLVMSNVKDFKHEWVWLKNRGSNFANTVREPMKEHESVVVFSRGKWIYNKQMQHRSKSGLARSKYSVEHNKQNRDLYRQFEGREHHNISELRVPSSYQKFNIAAGKEKTKHPTQKPVDMIEYFIKTYTNEGDTVFDPVMGSGSTGVACRDTSRHFIGIELDKSYFDIAKERILKSQKAKNEVENPT